ncbi:MAG TPA: S41 family peptidase [Sedimentisphaerales bacterium]|nr:S41 family peptidase [Sedimentisphaerales bacterium]
MRDTKHKIAISLSLCTLFLLLPVFTARCENSPAAETVEVVEQVCGQIYKGDFKAARGVLGTSAGLESPYLRQLEEAVGRYEELERNRQQQRQAAYKEQLAELEKFARGDANDVNDAAVWVESNSGLRAADSNGISKILSVVLRACEFADEQQKSGLLSESFVTEVFQRARSKADAFEAEGKWLDAYLVYYYWMQEIFPDNRQYYEYGRQLTDKAEIIASFQDSPCETSSQRYEGVRKGMFLRAIDVLDFNYVSVVDYRKMAIKALRRCQMLAEVLSKVSQTGRVKLVEKLNTTRYTLDVNKLRTWSAAVGEVMYEIQQLAVGVSKDRFTKAFDTVLSLNRDIGQQPEGLPAQQDTLLPETLLIAQFAEAALSVLDPYTVMVWPKYVEDFQKEMMQEFSGIGIEISKQKGMLTVVSLLPDTPAYNSGLDAGQVIEAVDGTATKDMSLVCAVRHITGPAGTQVTLTIRDAASEQSKDITITRAKITVPTIRGWKRDQTGRWEYMVDEAERIGYVRVTNFTAGTAEDLEEVLIGLEGAALKALIVDLRFNSGGLLNAAAEVADKFVKSGLIVKTQPRFGIPTWELAHRKKTHPDYPLVILINSYSASASEIVAGALADAKHKRAILVGTRTHGKGSVQGITHYPGGGAQLKYTMAYYHLPSGQRVESRDPDVRGGPENWGIAPHVEIELSSKEHQKMGEIQRDNSILVKADHDRTAEPLTKHSIEEMLAADPQLAVAVLVARAMLVEEQAKTAREKGDSRKIASLKIKT